MTRKMIVLTKDTHSSLFSVKNQMMTKRARNMTYDEVIQQLMSEYNINNTFKLEEKE